MLLLNAYYLATLPARRRAAADRAARGMEPVRVLFYHRVADAHPNDWTMPTGDVRRADSLAAASGSTSSTLAEAQRRIASGRNRWPTVCITFDDGYADNMQFAVPLLLQEQIPFTYFVSTNHVLRQPAVSARRGGRPAACRRTRSRNFANWPRPASRSAPTRATTSTWAASMPHDQLVDEIVGCEARSGSRPCEREVRYFAFPYGQPANLCTAAFRIAYSAGYHGVCSAYGGYNFPGDDPFHLRRIHADSRIDPLEELADGRSPQAPQSDRLRPGRLSAASVAPRSVCWMPHILSST